MTCIWLLLLIFNMTSSLQEGEAIRVHSRRFERINDEPSPRGTQYHVQAIVASAKVRYILSCDEFLSAATHQYASRCYDLSAGKDFIGYRKQNSMNFWGPLDKGKASYELNEYTIESEVEEHCACK
jgi:hypothetical protein